MSAKAEKLFLHRFFVNPKPIWSAFGCDIFFAVLQEQISTVGYSLVHWLDLFTKICFWKWMKNKQLFTPQRHREKHWRQISLKKIWLKPINCFSKIIKIVFSYSASLCPCGKICFSRKVNYNLFFGAWSKWSRIFFVFLGCRNTRRRNVVSRRRRIFALLLYSGISSAMRVHE